ncbi:flavodoxin domain-containing protein [Schaalia canis]|uniref:Flavodoxin n=1 Tax=Schaalia canis TaxID=100469 RepID=A0A3P1SDJ5_9ACTO|nr:flavodoxin domain-containing protein [Schaalia canis]RRC95094.1 flavodoxin [Schaalia canis]
MRILVTAASKHGATREIADRIAQRLGDAGHEVTCQAPEDVTSVDDFDAVVCGSAVYMTQWMSSAQEFVSRFEDQLAERPFWAFSVGMAGVPKHAPQDPSRIGPVLLRVRAEGHQAFPGRYKPELLNLRERSIARLAGAVEGDFRDWNAVQAWTDGIIRSLASDTE